MLKLGSLNTPVTAQKMEFSIKDFFSKCDQVRWKQRIWSHVLKKFLMENFIFLCSVSETYLEPTQRSKMELFKKMINGFTFSQKALPEIFEWVLYAFLPLVIGVSARKIEVEKEIAAEKIHCTKSEVFH